MQQQKKVIVKEMVNQLKLIQLIYSLSGALTREDIDLIMGEVNQGDQPLFFDIKINHIS